MVKAEAVASQPRAQCPGDDFKDAGDEARGLALEKNPIERHDRDQRHTDHLHHDRELWNVVASQYRAF